MDKGKVELDHASRVEEWQKAYRIKLHALREQYEKRKPHAEAVVERVENILRKCISDAQIKCEVSSRIKDFDSFRMKFRNKFYENIQDYKVAVKGNEKNIEKYAIAIQDLLDDAFSEISDMIGIRCIGLYTNEIYSFNTAEKETINLEWPYTLEEIIVNNFCDPKDKVIEKIPHSVIRTLKKYKLAHYDLRLKRKSLVEELEQELLDYSFEIQIRTYNQHIIDVIAHFLSYKMDHLFFPASKFEKLDENLKSMLNTMQEQIDELFDNSRKEFYELLRLIKGRDCTKLLDMPITPNTLKLYAYYEFCIVRRSEILSRKLPKDFEGIKFVDLWLNELADGLNELGYNNIEEIQGPTQDGIKFVEKYSLQSRKYIFKENDLTDILSKCLLFSIIPLRYVYPMRQETKDILKNPNNSSLL